MVGGEEWIGSTHCAFSWQSSPPDEGVGGDRRTLSPSAARQQMGRCPEQVRGGRRVVFLGSPSSWDHQLGLALRSRWDIEIPDCP